MFSATARGSRLETGSAHIPPSRGPWYQPHLCHRLLLHLLSEALLDASILLGLRSGPAVDVSLDRSIECCCNNTPESGKSIKNRSLFLTVLGLEALGQGLESGVGCNCSRMAPAAGHGYRPPSWCRLKATELGTWFWRDTLTATRPCFPAAGASPACSLGGTFGDLPLQPCGPLDTGASGCGGLHVPSAVLGAGTCPTALPDSDPGTPHPASP